MFNIETEENALKMVIGDRIKSLREKRGINQKELAQKIGISKSAMSKIESESRKVEDVLLIKICEVLETSADYLLGIKIKNITELNDNDKELADSIRKLPEIQKSAVKALVDSMNDKNKG